MSVTLSQQVALAATLRMRDDLIRAARAVPTERHNWSPGGVARNTIYLVAHCAATNLFFAAIFSSSPLPYQTTEEREAAVEGCETIDQAEALLNRSVTAVCDAIVALPEQRIGEQMVMPWGERMPVALSLLAPANHMQYHEGQINYLQTLLGDDEYH